MPVSQNKPKAAEVAIKAAPATKVIAAQAQQPKQNLVQQQQKVEAKVGVWSDMDEIVDSNEYSESEQQALEEQQIHNPSAYTMSYEQFQKKNKDAEVEAL